MTISLSEIRSLAKTLKNSVSWDSDELIKLSLSVVRKSLSTNVSLCKNSDQFVIFNVDLKKDHNQFIKECLIFLIRTKLSRDNLYIADLFELIRRTLYENGLLGKPNLLFLFDFDEDSQEFFSDEFKDFFISDHDGFVNFFYTTQPRKHLIDKLSLLSNNRSNCPFHYLGPCLPDMFVGRLDIIKDILFSSQNAFAVSGGRRIGKSSLLLKLQSIIKNDEYSNLKFHPLYVDCSNMKSFQSLVDYISYKLFPKYYKDDVSSPYEINFKTILGRVSGLWQKKLLLLLDEMDPLIKKAKLKKEDATSFFNSIRAEGNKRKLKIAIAGFRHVSEMITDSKHPFYNFVTGQRMKALSEKETRELISLPLVKQGIELIDKNKVVNEIYNSTAGHPSAVQYIARQLYINRKSDKIIFSDLLDVLNSTELIQFMLDSFIQNTNSFERLLCLISLEYEIINLEILLRAIKIERLKIKEVDKYIYLSLNNLYYNNILIRNKSNYEFIYPMMRHIIKDNYCSQEVLQTLKTEILNEEFRNSSY